MSYFQNAVDFTLAEARHAVTTTTNAASPETQPLYHHLSKILRNVDLAVKLCDKYTEFRQSMTKDDPWYVGTITSLYGAYFFIRRAVLGCTLPEMRPGLRAELRSLSSANVNTSYILLSYISNFMPHDLRCELGCVLTEEEWEHVPVDDRETRPSLAWQYMAIIIGLALQEKEQGVTGMLEAVWTELPVNEEGLEYSSDLDY